MEPLADSERELPFEGVLGTTAQLRTLELLLSMPRFEFSVSEISQKVGLSRTTAMKVVRSLSEWGMSSVLDRGRRVRYALNESDDLVSSLYAFNHAMLEKISPQQAKREIKLESFPRVPTKERWESLNKKDEGTRSAKPMLAP